MFKVGDKVSLLDEVWDCVVKEILTLNSCLVEDEHGFDRTVSIKDLVKIEPDKFKNIQVDSFSVDKKIKKVISKKPQDHIPRVDLHMENLNTGKEELRHFIKLSLSHIDSENQKSLNTKLISSGIWNIQHMRIRIGVRPLRF